MNKNNVLLVIVCILLFFTILSGTLLGYVDHCNTVDNSNTFIENTKINSLSDLDMNETASLNKFLSSFGESWDLDSYSSGMTDENYWLLHFVYNYLIRTNPDKVLFLKTDGNEYPAGMGISAEDADNTLKRFFGKTIPHAKADRTTGDVIVSWTFENEEFWFLSGTHMPGEVTTISIATDLLLNENDTYAVLFEQFYVETSDPDLLSSELFKTPLNKIIVNEKYLSAGTGSVILQPVINNNKETYTITSYQFNSNW